MRTARVIYHQEPEGWWAESPEVPGWSAAGESFDELRGLAEEGVRFFAEEELHLLHLKVGKEQVPAPATAGTPATNVVVDAAPLASAPRFDEGRAPTAGAENQTVPA